MLILIISGSDNDVSEIKQSTVMYGHQYIHTRNITNATIVLSEYEVDGIIVGGGVGRPELAHFVRALSTHPRYKNIPISDLSTGNFAPNVSSSDI